MDHFVLPAILDEPRPSQHCQLRHRTVSARSRDCCQVSLNLRFRRKAGWLTPSPAGSIVDRPKPQMDPMHFAGAYDLRLVTLSVVVAALASLTALDLAGRIRAASNWTRYAWLAAAAVAMGGGIWSMHFIGMLAFSMPGMMVSYDFGLTLLSLALPIAVTAFGFVVAIQPDTRWVGLLLSGIVMGFGIAAMHYTGMAAMRMNAQLSYEWWWVGISVAIAVGASTVALWLSLQRTNPLQRVWAAMVMGLAVSGMHYTAMQ